MTKLVDRLRRPGAYVAIALGVATTLFGDIFVDYCKKELDGLTSLIIDSRIFNYQNQDYRIPR